MMGLSFQLRLQLWSVKVRDNSCQEGLVVVVPMLEEAAASIVRTNSNSLKHPSMVNGNVSPRFEYIWAELHGPVLQVSNSS